MKIKVFNHPWHIAHQRELVRIPDTLWFWLQQPRRQYNTFPRGDFVKEYGVEWVADYEEGVYDLALLHLDQQCFEPEIWQRGKGSLYRMLNETIQDIPKVVIMHGTPFYPEMFAPDITEENYESMGRTKEQVNMSSFLIDMFRDAVSQASVIVFNSKMAKKQWGMENDPRAVAIWHGMDENDWVSLPKEPRVVTMISPAGLDAYYDRSLLRAVKDLLQEKDIEHCHITVDASFKSFEEYSNFLGRSLIYFNPTKESPMPRARTEAMMSGCCIVTMGGQDVEDFIDNGENGIIIPNRSPKLIVEVIESLLEDYKKAVELGEKARETARETFKLDRFHKEWRELVINKALNL